MGLIISNNGTKLFSSHWIIALFVIMTLLFVGGAQADIGTDWLLIKKTVDGSYVSDDDLVTHYQATAETILTLYAMDVQSAGDLQNSVSYLDIDGVKNTENIARLILSKKLLGIKTSELILELLRHQNSDGGFGDFAGYESTALDTAFALKALAGSSDQFSQTINHALSYLLDKQNVDGGFSLSDSNESHIYVASLCLSALQQYIFQYNLSDTIALATDYLFASLDASGTWNTHWETASALLAVIPVTADVTRYRDAVTALKNAQGTNGSWGDSVYTTALALRALHALNNNEPPIDITKGTFTGRVVEDGSNQPLVNVSVSLNDTGNTTVMSVSDGSFLLADVMPGNYEVSYFIDGYNSATQPASVSASQRVDLGVVSLPRLPDTGILSGIVTDNDTGQAISGALISTSGSLETAIETGSDGHFKLVLPPGDISVTIAANGYHSVQASGVISVGTTLDFSPALYLTGTPPPTNSSISIIGRVVDTLTGVAISRATINQPNTGLTTVTGSDGQFVLSQVEPGNISLEIVAENYIPVQSQFIAASGSDLDIGTLFLNKQTVQITSAVSGVVRDATTGSPIPGGVVMIEGSHRITTTNSEGRYSISGIDSLDFSLLVSVPGYYNQFTTLTLQDPVTTQVDFVLQAFSQDGIEIETFSTDFPGYKAYSPVLINTSIRNSEEEALTLNALLEVMDDQGIVIQQFQMGGTSAVTGTDESINLLPGAVLDLESEWNTGIYAPGVYQINIKVFDEYSNRLLSERQTSFVINETKELGSLTLKATPRYTHVGVEQYVELIATIINRSNVEQALTLEYQWLSPSGTILYSGTGDWVLKPDEFMKKMTVTSVPYQFSTSGDYPVDIQLLTEGEISQQESTFISVAPSVRVEVEQGVSPNLLVPDGDKRISVNIRLQGVEK